MRAITCRNENDGVPTEESVAEIFDAIIPLFPTQTITDLHLIIDFACSKEEFIEFLIFLESYLKINNIFTNFINSFFHSKFNVTRYPLNCARSSLLLLLKT